MPLNVRVGNDVVDLGAPRVPGKSADQRFLARILAPAERGLVERSLDPDLELWSLWAAKEAAYKVVSKLQGAPPPFVHADFVVAWAAPARGSGPAAPTCHGTVSYGDQRVPVTVALKHGVLHAVAHAMADSNEPSVSTGLELLDRPGAPWTGPLERLLTALSDRETAVVHSRASAAVRIGAKAELSRALGLDVERLEIVCAPGRPGRRPPEVLLDGAPAAADVSLSHHGAWIGWAVWTGGATGTTLS